MTDAWATRPSTVVTQKQVISATRSVTITRTIYTDTTLIDRMHARGQLSERQHRAGCRLYGLWLASGLAPRVTARHDVVEESEDDADTIDAPEPREDARTAYRRTLRHAGPLFGPMLDALMHGQYPGVQRLATCQSALDFLADGWGLEK